MHVNPCLPLNRRGLLLTTLLVAGGVAAFVLKRK